jgi:hypothetical protein
MPSFSAAAACWEGEALVEVVDCLAEAALAEAALVAVR